MATAQTTVTETSTRRLPLWVACLAVAAFVAGTDNYVIAGVLPDIASSFNISDAVTGQLITVFSITYAVTALIMAVWTSRFPRRPVVLIAMSVFIVANIGATAAPDYAVLMAFRVLAALAAATVMPSAFTITVGLAPRAQMGRYLGMVMFGQALALVAGVPIGVWIGSTFGWRSTLLFVACLAALVLVSLIVWLPGLDVIQRLSLRTRLAPLANRAVVLGLIGLIVGSTGNFMTVTYIAPITHYLAGSTAGTLSLLLSVMGVASALGAIRGGKISDRWGPGKTIVASLVCQVAVTAVFGFCGLLGVGKVPIVVVGVLLTGWGIFGGALGPPLQARLLMLAGSAGNEVVALNSAGVFVGIALSGAFGGAILAASNPDGVLWAAAGFGALAAVIMVVSIYGVKVKAAKTADQPAAGLRATPE